jgi:hypothetical protein
MSKSELSPIDAADEIDRLARLCEKLAKDVAERDALLVEKDAALTSVQQAARYSKLYGHDPDAGEDCAQAWQDADEAVDNALAKTLPSEALERTLEEARQQGRDEAMLAMSKMEPVAHMFPSDLEKFEEQETFAQAYSVAVGNPDERSVELIRRPTHKEK